MKRRKFQRDKTNTPVWAILLVFVCTIFVSAAQLLLKTGVMASQFTLFAFITNPFIILGILFYGLGGLIMIFALRSGEVTILFPIMTSSYIWVSLGSLIFLDETISIARWGGIILIVLGIMTLNTADNIFNKRIIKRWKLKFGL